MTGRVVEIAGQRAWLLDETGPALDERLASDIIGETFGAEVRLVVIPTARLPTGFLDLKTRLAGELLQKFVNYRRRPVILGDVSAAAGASAPLRDFIFESNRGTAVWFAQDVEELIAKLNHSTARPGEGRDPS